jgi:hypothetical protein
VPRAAWDLTVAIALTKMAWRAHIRALHPESTFVYGSLKNGVFDRIRAFNKKDDVPVGYWRDEDDWQVVEPANQRVAA